MAKKTGELQGVIMDVGPDMARAFLEKNIRNRPLSNRWVDRIAARMKRGEWQINGEAIKLSSDGQLLDGQHRLEAIVRSKLTVKLYVIKGVDADAFNTMDQNKTRGAGDILSINGSKNYNILAAAARLAMGIKSMSETARIPNNDFSPVQIVEFIRENPQIEAGIAQAKRIKRITTPSISAAMKFLFHEKSSELSVDFFDKLEFGANMRRLHPVITLRDRLMEDSSSNSKLTRAAVCAFFVKAWNAFIYDADLTVLAWRTNEAFPIILEPNNQSERAWRASRAPSLLRGRNNE